MPLHSSQGAAPPEPHWLYAELCPSALAQPPHGLPADLRGQRRRRGVLADQGAVGGCGRAGGQLGTGDMGRGWGCRGLTPGAPLSCTDHAKGAAPACAHGPQAGCGPAGEGGLVPVPPIPHPHSSQLTPLQMHNGSNCICPARPGPPGPKVRSGGGAGGPEDLWGETPGLFSPFSALDLDSCFGVCIAGAVPLSCMGQEPGSDLIPTGRERRPRVPRGAGPAGAVWGEREDGQPGAAGSPGASGPPRTTRTSGATRITGCWGSQESTRTCSTPQGIRERGERWGGGIWCGRHRWVMEGWGGDGGMGGQHWRYCGVHPQLDLQGQAGQGHRAAEADRGT